VNKEVLNPEATLSEWKKRVIENFPQPSIYDLLDFEFAKVKKKRKFIPRKIVKKIVKRLRKKIIS
jgi:hypothetical protein